MKLKDMLDAVGAQVLWGDEAHDAAEVGHVVASDLMSDVLTVDHDGVLLLTSLVSDQTLRTANVVGAAGVLVANGKMPPADMVRLAGELGMPLGRTALSKFDAAVALGKALGG